KTYDWYVIAADNYTGTAISDIWSFTKGQPAPEVPSEPGDGDGEDGGSEDPTIPNPDDNDGGSEDPTIPNPDDNDGGSEDPTIPNP
ncbi:hypothetical protein A499_25429, partial [Niallia nealsonii AAU1]